MHGGTAGDQNALGKVDVEKVQIKGGLHDTGNDSDRVNGAFRVVAKANV